MLFATPVLTRTPASSIHPLQNSTSIGSASGWSQECLLRVESGHCDPRPSDYTCLVKEAFILAIAGTFVALTGPVDRRSMPVWDGSLPPAESVKGNDCNVAKVVSSIRSRHLLVRAGPGPAYPAVGRLRPRIVVFVCNEASGRPENGRQHWFGLAYVGPGKPCTGATSNGLDVRRSRNCRSGWVDAHWITLISG
jgi:hypothetical protein